MENDMCEIRGEILHPAFLFGASFATCKLFLFQWPRAGLLHLLLLKGRMLLRKGALLWLGCRDWHRDLFALLLLLGTRYRVRGLDRGHYWDLFALLLLCRAWGGHRDLLGFLLLLEARCRFRVLDRDWHWDLFALLLLLGTRCRFRLLNRFWHRDLLAFLLLLGTGYRLRILDRDLFVLLLLLRTLCRFRDFHGDLLALLLLLGGSFRADSKDWLWQLFAC